jgi:nucleoid-associated protein EbfC
LNPFGDPRKMMKQIQQMQERLQQEIAAIEVEATAGGGMVKVEMDGQKALRSVTIDPEVVSKEDVAMLQDLIVAAVNEASRKVDAEVAEKTQSLAGGLPKIPGLF